jgi:hypothetical protein
MLRVLEAADDCTGLAVPRHICLAAPGSLRCSQTIREPQNPREREVQTLTIRSAVDRS